MRNVDEIFFFSGRFGNFGQLSQASFHEKGGKVARNFKSAFPMGRLCILLKLSFDSMAIFN